MRLTGRSCLRTSAGRSKMGGGEQFFPIRPLKIGISLTYMIKWAVEINYFLYAHFIMDFARKMGVWRKTSSHRPESWYQESKYKKSVGVWVKISFYRPESWYRESKYKKSVGVRRKMSSHRQKSLHQTHTIINLFYFATCPQIIILTLCYSQKPLFSNISLYLRLSSYYTAGN